MYDSETKKNSAATQPDHLLDELTSIKDLLGGEHPVATGAIPHHDIPVLDDIVDQHQPGLLDIERIFSEEAGAEVNDHSTRSQENTAGTGSASLRFPKFTLDVALSDAPPANHPASAGNALLDNLTDTLRANYRRELLIQELVGEFLPQIEAALRERLESLEDTALQALKTPTP